MVFAAYVESFTAVGYDLLVRLNDDSVEVLNAITDIRTHCVTAAERQLVHLFD